MGLLDGTVVFITGGGRGQGRAHAIVSAREGADIVFVDTTAPFATVPYAHTTADDIAETVRQVEALDRRVLSIEADVRDQDALDSAVAAGIAEFGKIDALIANAGIWTLGPVQEMTRETWQEMIDINITGVWQSVKAVVPHMIERQQGSIVMTSSVNGLEGGPFFSHYTAAKFAVVGFMKAIAVELGPQGIRANTVNPGTILTGMTNNQQGYDMMAGHPGGTREDLLAAGRSYGILKGSGFLDPEVIANAALFLNSSLASNVTGISLPVDSGHLAMAGINMDPKQ
ncbi:MULTISPECIES: mycofactocin-coupled SDR family oxidoreductase [Subtercola]|uniref:NAD(P)-dependent oxidoreductase n=1 Tax=Subtercola vilae TaxID=2056433 RepID=A0A4T2BRX2_9MICO|nr:MULTISPECIES: mycofactocin-coupled SDR family oxidoreductase [Subtercola]MEA9986560.1 mycofactocin-coupled SDR family oxidoreductase [Subtercola sp. RTI3]TIH32058.1 NAD(P)-dependent oxidoreductase [Subtercola vilae]